MWTWFFSKCFTENLHKDFDLVDLQDQPLDVTVLPLLLISKLCSVQL